MTRPTAPAMITVAEARERILAGLETVPGTELVPLGDALGRVVATAYVASRDVPPSDNSAMDGYALRTDELAAAGGVLPLAGRVAAGDPPASLPAGAAMVVLTGAVLPSGADAVVPQEACEVDGDVVRVRQPEVVRGAHIRPAGEDIARGTVALPAGRRVRPQDIGVAASVGATALEVRRPVRVAVVATGDELVPVGEPLAPGQLYDSNGPMLVALLSALGCRVTLATRVGDDLDATIRTLDAARAEADLVVTSGGVSVGEEDHVKAAVRALGHIEVWKVAVQPGKPIGFGRLAAVPWLGLPGNPLSGLVTFLVFGVPLVRRLQGRDVLVPRSVPVAAGFTRKRPNEREEYVRVSLEGERLMAYRHQGSGVLSSAAWGDGLARVPAGALVREGDALAYTGYADLLA